MAPHSVLGTELPKTAEAPSFETHECVPGSLRGEGEYADRFPFSKWLTKKRLFSWGWQGCQTCSRQPVWRPLVLGPRPRGNLFAVSLKVRLPGRPARALNPVASLNLESEGPSQGEACYGLRLWSPLLLAPYPLCHQPWGFMPPEPASGQSSGGRRGRRPRGSWADPGGVRRVSRAQAQGLVQVGPWSTAATGSLLMTHSPLRPESGCLPPGSLAKDSKEAACPV